MPRREFPKAVRVAVVKRAMRDGVVHCEKCGAMAKTFQIDHVRPDGLLGEPTLANAQLLGPCCYGQKNADDTSNIAKAKRREAAHLGVNRRPKHPLQSGGSLKGPQRTHEGRGPAVGLSEIARRYLGALNDV